LYNQQYLFFERKVQEQFFNSRKISVQTT